MVFNLSKKSIIGILGSLAAVIVVCFAVIFYVSKSEKISHDYDYKAAVAYGMTDLDGNYQCTVEFKNYDGAHVYSSDVTCGHPIPENTFKEAISLINASKSKVINKIRQDACDGDSACINTATVDFIGWYKDNGHSQRLVLGEPIYSNINLYPGFLVHYINDVNTAKLSIHDGDNVVGTVSVLKTEVVNSYTLNGIINTAKHLTTNYIKGVDMTDTLSGYFEDSNVPKKSNSILDNYYTTDAFETAVNKKYNQNVHIYMKFNTVIYVSYYAVDGSTVKTIEGKEFDYNKGNVEFITVPTSKLGEGKKMSGKWYYDSALTKEAKTTDKFSTLSDVETDQRTGKKYLKLYGEVLKIAADTYTIKYDGDGATKGTMLETTCSTGQNCTLRTNTYEKNGFTFVGWKTSSKVNGEFKNYTNGATVKDLTTSGKSITLVAQWKSDGASDSGTTPTTTLNQVRVTYKVNGGSLTGDTYKDVYYNKTYGDLPTSEDIVKSGYILEGWYLTEDFSGTKVTSTTEVRNNKSHYLYAHWVGKTYNITLNPNGVGATVNQLQKEVTYGKTYGTLPTPTWDASHAFKNWYTDPTKEGDDYLVTSSTTVEKTTGHTLYAHWKSSGNVTIVFNSERGSCPTNVTKELGHGLYYYLPSKAYCESPGYVFLGWYYHIATGPQDKDISIDMDRADYPTEYSGRIQDGHPALVNGKVQLYAKWKPYENDFYVAFDTQGGLGIDYGKELIYGGVYGELPIAYKEGNAFGGWCLNKNNCANTLVSPTTVVTQEDQHVLYAYWISKTSSNQLTIDLEYNKNFKGKELMETEVTVTKKGVYGYLPTPSGYSGGLAFKGWSLDSDCGQIVKESTIVDETKTTLYGCWSTQIDFQRPDSNGEQPELTVRFDNNIWDALPNATNKLVYNETNIQEVKGFYTPGDAFSNLPTPNAPTALCQGAGIECYFDGWYLDPGTYKYRVGNGVTYVGGFDGELTLYAKWTTEVPETGYDPTDGLVPVKFDLNGGVTTDGEDLGTMNVLYGKQYGEMPTNVVKTGYVFDGWFIDRYLTIPVKTSETSNRIVALNTPHTVYARWSPILYMVTLDVGEGGTLSTKSLGRTYGRTYGGSNGLPTPTAKSGYVFEGWYSNSDYQGDPITDSTIMETAADHTLYAKWQQLSGGTDFDITDVSNYTLFKGYIIIPAKTTSSQLSVKSGYNIAYQKASGKEESIQYVGTGDTVTITKTSDTSETKTYTVIVVGDVDGNGKLSMMDYMMIRRYLVNKLELTGVNLVAADVNQDNNMSMMDYMTLKYHIIESVN